MDNVLSNVTVAIDAATSTTTSAEVFTATNAKVTWIVSASDVTTGGTVLIEGTMDRVNWYTLATVSVTADGGQYVIVDELHMYQRARVSSRTDGTYTVKYAPELER